MLTLKRITDPDYLLCHRCGRPLRETAHRECAEAARRESGCKGKEPSGIERERTRRLRHYEGVGTLGHSPCRLDDGSTIVPIEEARKIREEGFTSNQTGVKYPPWTNGAFRERTRGQREEEEEEEYWDVEDNEDLCSLIYGYPSKIFLLKLSASSTAIQTPEE